MMAEPRYAIRRINPRYPFFADAEVNLKGGLRLPAQVTELSSRGCYVDALEPVPVGTDLRLHISYGVNDCEITGKVIYKHSGGGFGVFGMGVLFGDMNPEQSGTIHSWLDQVAGQGTTGAEPSPSVGDRA